MKRHTRAVLFDLDSTIANTYHRQHMVPAIRDGKLTWDDYAMACAEDETFPGVVRLATLMWMHFQVHIVSGRSDVALDLTDRWLRRYGVPFDVLKLRPPGHYESNSEFKISYIRELKAAGIDASLFVEDWKSTGDEITAATGVPCLIVNPCYPEDAPEGKEIGHGLAPASGT